MARIIQAPWYELHVFVRILLEEKYLSLQLTAFGDRSCVRKQDFDRWRTGDFGINEKAGTIISTLEASDEDLHNPDRHDCKRMLKQWHFKTTVAGDELNVDRLTTVRPWLKKFSEWLLRKITTAGTAHFLPETKEHIWVTPEMYINADERQLLYVYPVNVLNGFPLTM
jgi:hypothetical protein